MKKHKRTQRFLIAAIVAIFFAASHIAAQNVSEAELQFREALHKQQVEGDLAGATSCIKTSRPLRMAIAL